jgi:uncharacterized protein YndB with AHSA1/START domain
MATRKSTAPAKRAKAKTAKSSAVSKVKVTAKGERELVITRTFAAPRTLVFDAMSKPAMVKQWLHGPPGWSLTTCKIDLRVAGKFRYVWSNADGTGMGLGGVYKEVERPERIVNTEKFDEAWYAGESLHTMVFTEQGKSTLMTLTIKYDSKATRDGVLASPMEGGLEFSYQQLDALFARQGKGTTKKENALFTGISEPEKVDAFMKSLKHPKKGVAEQLRKVILSVDKRVGECIIWNAPCFYFTGEMKPFDPKTYKRYIVGFNFFKKDVIRLIFLRGADVKKHAGLLDGDYKDGRRLALITSLQDVKKHEKILKSIVRELINKM